MRIVFGALVVGALALACCARQEGERARPTQAVLRGPGVGQGANAPVEALTVAATMPEHRHGMNYRPSVTAAGAGMYRADGLLLHMPGRWELMFGVRTGGWTERLTASELVP